MAPLPSTPPDTITDGDEVGDEIDRNLEKLLSTMGEDYSLVENEYDKAMVLNARLREIVESGVLGDVEPQVSPEELQRVQALKERNLQMLGNVPGLNGTMVMTENVKQKEFLKGLDVPDHDLVREVLGDDVDFQVSENIYEKAMVLNQRIQEMIKNGCAPGIPADLPLPENTSPEKSINGITEKSQSAVTLRNFEEIYGWKLVTDESVLSTWEPEYQKALLLNKKMTTMIETGDVTSKMFNPDMLDFDRRDGPIAPETLSQRKFDHRQRRIREIESSNMRLYKSLEGIANTSQRKVMPPPGPCETHVTVKRRFEARRVDIENRNLASRLADIKIKNRRSCMAHASRKQEQREESERPPGWRRGIGGRALPPASVRWKRAFDAGDWQD